MPLTTAQQYKLSRFLNRKLASEVSLGDRVAKAAGTFTTVGGDASETITLSGLLATDVCIVTVKTQGAGPQTILAASCSAGQIDVTMSGDPAADHVLQYVVYSPSA